jgi:hypothetical protein
MNPVIGLLKVRIHMVIKDGFCPLDIKRYNLQYYSDKQDQPDDHYDLVNLARIVCEAKTHACLKPGPPVL